MTRKEIVNILSEETVVPRKEVDQVIVSLFKVITDNLFDEKTIFFRGFGTFGTKIRNERTARNIKTNEAILVPKHRVVYFQPGKDLKAIKKQSKLANENH